MKIFKMLIKFSNVISLGLALSAHEGFTSSQASLRRMGINTDLATAHKMLQNQSLITEYQQHAKAAGMTAEEYVKAKEAHPNESAADIVTDYQLGKAVAHAGIAVDDKNKQAAKRLQALRQPLTPQSIAATVYLQNNLHIANPTLKQINAAKHLWSLKKDFDEDPLKATIDLQSQPADKNANSPQLMAPALKQSMQ